MAELKLSVGIEDFKAIQSGEKKSYHRPLTKPWIAKIVNQKYENIIILNGSNKLVIPYRGYRVVTVKREQGEQKVFEIITAKK